MAPKVSFVYLITSEDDSAPVAVYADSTAANEAAKDYDGAEVHKLELKGGSVKLDGEAKPTKPAPKPKAAKPAPAPAPEEDDGETSELAERVKELLATSGDSLSGCNVVIISRSARILALLWSEKMPVRRSWRRLRSLVLKHLMKKLSSSVLVALVAARSEPHLVKRTLNPRREGRRERLETQHIRCLYSS